MARKSTAGKRPAEKSEGQSTEDAAIVRKQLLWIVGILVGAALVSAGIYWGRETGWGDPAKAVARKMAQGEAAFVANDLDGAVRYYAAVVRRYPKDPQASQALTQEATALQQLGRLSEALAVLQSLDQRLADAGEKSDLKAYTLLQIAKVKKDLTDLDGAMATYQKVRTDHPKTDWAGEAQSGIGAVLQAEHKYKDARAAYQVLVKELPGGFLAAEAQTAIGECLEAEGDLKGARRAYQTVLDHYPQAVWDSAKARLDALKKDLENAKASKKSEG
jgi:TolA-binding protein